MRLEVLIENARFGFSEEDVLPYGMYLKADEYQID